MKRHPFQKTALAVAIALTATIGSAMSVAAANNTALSASSATDQSKESLAAKRKLLSERHQKVEQEALAAITGTQNALMALKKGDTKQAMALLQDVSGKLDILLAKYPGLNLIPANIEANVYDFDNDAKQVEKIVDAADDLLGDHRVQDARKILNQLVSEIRITTINIPLGTYPQAIKDAVKLIDQGKTKEAEEALYDVLNLLVETTEIMPLPVLRAETLLTAASEYEHKSDLTKEASRTEILILADAAKDKLKLAEILGYGNKDDYKVLYDSIDELKDVIHSEKSAATWDKIKNTFSAFKDKITHPQKSK
jgi:hypothetical protein